MPSQRMQAAAVALRPAVKDILKRFLESCVRALTTMGEKASEQTRSKQLDLVSLYTGDKFDKEELLQRVNSEPTRLMKEAWRPLGMLRLAMTDALSRLHVDKFKSFDVETLLSNAGYEDAEAVYDEVLLKISEVTAVRALCRPETAQDTRKSQVAKGTEMIASLNGRLAPTLDMLMKQHTTV